MSDAAAERFPVARVLMPERGVFTVRAPFACAPHQRAVVSLDYGEDVGMVLSVEEFDPVRHGPRVPGFQLVRPYRAADAAAEAENASLAAAMRTVFVKTAQPTVPDLRVPYIRLSFGRTRVFIRFVSERMRPDLGRAVAEVAHRWGVTVNVWQLGPRDEVAALGALGPCGRVCCCASWQMRYPSGLNAERARAAGGSPSQLNGSCGKYKCCLAFEDAESGVEQGGGT